MTTPSASLALSLATAALEASERATPGPWRWGNPSEGLCKLIGNGSRVLELADGWGVLANDTKFIAHARTALPQLAAWVVGLLGVEPFGDINVRSLTIAWTDGAAYARALAAALLRAADEAEGK